MKRGIPIEIMPFLNKCRIVLHAKSAHGSGRSDRRSVHLLLLLQLIFLVTFPPLSLQAQINPAVPTTTPTVAPTPSITATPTEEPTPAPTPTLDANQRIRQQLDEQIDQYLQMMSPEERVGQLFVIAFEGNEISPSSDITELIHEYRIGGVILKPAKENFTNAKGVNTPAEITALTNQLQALAYGYLLPIDNALTFTTTAPSAIDTITATETTSQSILTSLGLLPLSTAEFSDPLPAANDNVDRNDSIEGESPENDSPTTLRHIPLLIGVEQLGDGHPATALRRGFTSIPSQLALGSTWDFALAQEVGAIVGKELRAVGINLMLGPSLDVTDQPRTDPVGALGVHTFGGNPYWVGKMGSAYIAGVHEGSNYRVATIARHFPGQGDIDRLPNQEVATVQQSLSELQQIDLPPFLKVTNQPSKIIAPNGSSSAVEGLMTSHMRYSAFQGTSSTRVPPISLMPELNIVLAQQGFGEWHDDGGILMTNSLGVPAIRRYYEAPLQEFPYRRVALDAFVAGHDLLYLAQLSADDFWNTEREYIKDIVHFFRERYNTDPDFQTQVDAAVRRILRLKFHLYRYREADSAESGPSTIYRPVSVADDALLVPLSDVLVPADTLRIFDETSEHREAATLTVGQVARDSITVLYPDVAELSDALPSAPQESDQLLIFSDSRLFQECKNCTAETMLGPDEIKEIMIRLYGSDPGATGQITADRIYGRSFAQLQSLLSEPSLLAPLGATTEALTQTTTISPTSNGRSAGIPTADVEPTLRSAPVEPISTPGATATTLAEPIITPISGEEADDVQETVPLTPNERLYQLIEESNWLIFAMLDVDAERNPGSDVVKQFLRQQSERLGDKQVIVLALNAPYFLDATEISKLTAYLGVYSKTQPSLESAVRAIFRSYTPTGAPAVSVPGTRFGNLSERLAPDPTQNLPLAVTINDIPVEFSPDGNTEVPIVDVGNLIRLQVEQVLDHNGHPVPDGVPVNFRLDYENQEVTIAVEPALTRNGSAVREVILEQPGSLLISAVAGEASTAMDLALRVQDPTAVENTELTPNSEIEGQLEITATVQPTATSLVPQPGLTTLPDTLPGSAINEKWANLETLIIAILTIIVTLSLLLILQIHILPRSILVHNMLWATICGLGAYILFAMGLLPGRLFLSNTLRIWSAAVVVFIGMLLPLLWLQLQADTE